MQNNWELLHNNIEHITNNASESFNNFFKKIFPKKKKMSINRTDEIKALIEWYKNKEEKLICIGCSDDDIIELWYDCLIHLNNIKY